MAYTESDLTAKISALETALARGVQTVQFADRSTTYSSPSAVLVALDYFKSLLNGVRSQAQRRPRQFVAVGYSGLRS